MLAQLTSHVHGGSDPQIVTAQKARLPRRRGRRKRRSRGDHRRAGRLQNKLILPMLFDSTTHLDRDVQPEDCIDLKRPHVYQSLHVRDGTSWDYRHPPVATIATHYMTELRGRGAPVACYMIIITCLLVPILNNHHCQLLLPTFFPHICIQ